MKEQQAQREEQVKEVWSSSKTKEDPVDNNDEEEEDPGSSNGYGLGEEEEDKDLPSSSAHRPITRSTPKKPISRPKWKAYRSKGSGPGDSSRKWSKGQS